MQLQILKGYWFPLRTGIWAQKWNYKGDFPPHPWLDVFPTQALAQSRMIYWCWVLKNSCCILWWRRVTNSFTAMLNEESLSDCGSVPLLGAAQPAAFPTYTNTSTPAHTHTWKKVTFLPLIQSHGAFPSKTQNLDGGGGQARLTERWHFSASGGGRSTGFSVIDVRALCSLDRCQWHIKGQYETLWKLFSFQTAMCPSHCFVCPSRQMVWRFCTETQSPQFKSFFHPQAVFTHLC